jgi:hypothetical protein
MNQENRDKVNNYLNSFYVQSLSPLKFNNYESNKEEFDSSKHSIESMVLRALELTKMYPSYDVETNEFECLSKAMRSSLDIWRHIKYYYPDVTIFQVMNALFNVYEGGTDHYGLFCCNINRRVFKVGRKGFTESSWMRDMSSSGRSVDEYGLVWDDWKDI